MFEKIRKDILFTPDVSVGVLPIPLACLISFMPIISVVQGVMGAVKTSNGEDFRYWWVGDWLRGTLKG